MDKKLGTIEKVNDLIDALKEIGEKADGNKEEMFRSIVDDMFDSDKKAVEKRQQAKEEQKATVVTDNEWSKEDI